MYEELKSLKELLDAGAITQDDYDRKKVQILGIGKRQPEHSALGSTQEDQGPREPIKGDGDLAKKSGGSGLRVIAVVAIAVLAITVLVAFLFPKNEIVGRWDCYKFMTDGEITEVVGSGVTFEIDFDSDGGMSLTIGDETHNGTWSESDFMDGLYSIEVYGGDWAASVGDTDDRGHDVIMMTLEDGDMTMFFEK